MTGVACGRCDGCGQIANSDKGEAWTSWSSLPPGSDIAVKMGIVKPIPCPACAGSGGVPVKSPRSAIEELYERVQRLEAAVLDAYAVHPCDGGEAECPFCMLGLALEKAVTP